MRQSTAYHKETFCRVSCYSMNTLNMEKETFLVLNVLSNQDNLYKFDLYTVFGKFITFSSPMTLNHKETQISSFLGGYT